MRGNSAGALGESGFVARLLAGGEFALGVSVEISTVAVESEHEEELGVQARGGDVVRGEAGDGGGEGRLQLHGIYFNTEAGGACGKGAGGASCMGPSLCSDFPSGREAAGSRVVGTDPELLAVWVL